MRLVDVGLYGFLSYFHNFLAKLCIAIVYPIIVKYLTAREFPKPASDAKSWTISFLICCTSWYHRSGNRMDADKLIFQKIRWRHLLKIDNQHPRFAPSMAELGRTQGTFLKDNPSSPKHQKKKKKYQEKSKIVGVKY